MPQQVGSNTALQRLVTITSVLASAEKYGRCADELLQVAHYGGTAESQRESLARDIRNLHKLGIDIRNVAELGVVSHYVLHPSDSRVRMAFTAEQRAELARAAFLADRASVAAEFRDGDEPGVETTTWQPIRIDTVDLPVELDVVLRAVAANCLLRFHYNGKDRVFDPHVVQHEGRQWTVSGYERIAEATRVFAIVRMNDVELDPPGSARPADPSTRTSVDPLMWEMDPPLVAQISFERRYLSDIAAMLPVTVVGGEDQSQFLQASFTVTNRWILFARLAELGERVVLDGCQQLREEFGNSLRAVVSGVV